MNCASFERDLARLLAGELVEPERERTLELLRGHAERCDGCGAAADLLRLAALPAAERDWVEEPGSDYWADFYERVERRAAETPAVAGATWRRWGLVAALLAIAAVLWLVVPPRRDPAGGSPGAAETISAPLPESLDRMLETAPEGALLDELDFLAGLDGLTGEGEADRGGGWLYPDTEDLDVEMRDELLLWLQEQTVEDRGVTS
jgi:hypothetical protein